MDFSLTKMVTCTSHDRRTSMKVVRLDCPIDSPTLTTVESAKPGVKQILSINRSTSLSHLKQSKKIIVVPVHPTPTHVPHHAHRLADVDP